MAVSANNDSCAPLHMGGYDCDFVDPPPDSLQCPVCLLPFRDPALLSCCGHKGCASCIGRIKAAGHPCPLCQQPFETMLDKHFQRKVLDLRVFCSKKEEGCSWKGELRDLETHSSRSLRLMSRRSVSTNAVDATSDVFSVTTRWTSVRSVHRRSLRKA